VKCLPAILIVSLLVGSARADWLSFGSAGQSTSVHPAVVRIVAPGRDSISYGSGSLVAKNGKHGLVITNWHVINELTGQLMVVFPDGFQSAGTVLKADKDWDLAAITIWRPTAEPLALATAAPQQGETLTIAGYGSGKYRSTSGKCTQYVAPGPKFPFEIVELAATARQGDSGGPIFNSRGELAGVLFGEGHGRTAGSYCGRVQWFLSSVVPSAELDGGKSMIANRDLQSPSGSSSPGGRVVAQTVSVTAGMPGASLASVLPVTRPAAAPPAVEPLFRSASSLGRTQTADTLPRPVRPTTPAVGVLNPGISTAGISTAGISAPPRSSRMADPVQYAASRLSSGEPAAAPQVPQRKTVGWTDVAGDTRGEQLKTIFAAVGVAALLLHSLSWLGSESRQPAAEKPKRKKKARDEDEDDDDDDDDDDEDDD
jgi:hypothetical protein